MKKISMFLAALALLAFSASYASAQEEEVVDDATIEAEDARFVDESEINPFNVKSEVPLHQALKTKFIEGGAGFMSPIIICLIIGLALSIERILYLSFSKVNVKELVAKVEEALAQGGIDAAKDVCRNTRGPVAKIFYDGLDRVDQGVDVVEKNIVSSGSVQMTQLENGLSWISLFIAIAPSLGFLGTVIGMIQAFDAIQAAGDISPNVVAGGMKVALITTVGGLIVAMILQVFYNYILAKIDSITIDMEEASIDFIDVLSAYKAK